MVDECRWLRGVAEPRPALRLDPPLDRPRLRRRRGRYREDDAPGPVNATAARRQRPSGAWRQLTRTATIARTSLLYGGSEPGPQERLALEGTRFFVDEIRSPVQVGDLAEALLELLALELPGPLHLGGADDLTRFDFAVLLGADPARIERAHTTPDRAPDVSLDSTRARELLRTRLRGVYASSAAVRSAPVVEDRREQPGDDTFDERRE